MVLRHIDIEIPASSPFQNCQLGREKYAKVLTKIIESYPDGFVIAVNNKWGTGKTTFVKMWEQLLKNAEFKTIYFNAWENDFEDNPLTAFVGELQVINKKQKDNFNKLIKNAALLSKNVAPAFIKSLLGKYLDLPQLTDAISNTSKSFLEIFEDDVKEYSKRKESILEFKQSLSEFVANESGGKPLIFIVDELDRCRPNYAVLLLEQIKHFFAVPNIIFILSIDKTQLGNAICGFYGSDKIDSNEYLRRFIDIEYSIPEPEKERFFHYLYEYYEFDAFFSNSERKRYNGLQHDRDNFIMAGKTLLNHLTLRQQEKIMSHTRLALRTLRVNSYLFPTVFTFLSFVKSVHPDYYQKMANKSLSLKELQEQFYGVIEHFVNKSTQRLFVQIEAYLLCFYENYLAEFRQPSQLFERSATEAKYILKMESLIDSDTLLSMITSERFLAEYRDMELSYFLNKLDLIEDIIIN